MDENKWHFYMELWFRITRTFLAIPGLIGQVTRPKFYKEVNDLRLFHLAEQNCTPEKPWKENEKRN